MTREEARNWFEAYLSQYNDPLARLGDLPYEIAQAALSALRPVSREQVEKVWRGELKENLSSSYKNEITYCAECGHDFFDFTQIRNFCPVCGKALTDEAVQMVMERLEALKDGDLE